MLWCACSSTPSQLQGLTLHYLQVLVNGLHQYDLLAPLLPALALELVIADGLADCRTWSTLVRMR